MLIAVETFNDNLFLYRLDWLQLYRSKKSLVLLIKKICLFLFVNKLVVQIFYEWKEVKKGKVFLNIVPN
jgi:hypothetical protein